MYLRLGTPVLDQALVIEPAMASRVCLSYHLP